MKKNIFFVVFLCISIWGYAQNLIAPFAHPGLNHSQADLDRVKEKVLAGEHPWIDGWEVMCANRDAQSDFGPNPSPSLAGADGVRQRASRDATAAYYNILRWYVTGDVSHAECAVNILNAWSESIQTVVTGELFMLPACDFMKAAELVRLYPGWKEEDRERFDKMARDYIYPACRDFRGVPGTWPGWDGPANTACLYIGIYLDDAEKVNDAIEYYKNGKGGGCITEGIVFDGQPVEMGRDQPHAAIGIDSYADFCQALWNQGLDMFSYQDNLLLKGFEYYARYNLEFPVDWEAIDYHGHKFYYPAPSNNAPYSMPNNRVLANELIYHHYADRKGMDVKELRTMLRLKNVDILTGTMYTFSDTTTVYAPLPTPEVPSGLTATGGVGRIDIDWEPSALRSASGYEVQRSNSAEAGFETVGSWTGNVTTCYADKDIEPGKTYYYRVKATNRSGDSEWSETVEGKAVTGSITNYLSGWTQCDVGKEDWMIDGYTKYDAVNGNTFELTGAGRDIYDPSHPEGNYTYTAVNGDFELTTRIYDGEQDAGEIKVKFGISVRENTTTSSQKILFWIGDNGVRNTHFIWRGTSDGGGWIDGSDHTWIPVWLKLKRQGDTFEASVSDNGERWYVVGSSEIPFPESCLVGLWVCSGAYLPEGYTAGFDHVTLQCPETVVPAMPTQVKAEAAGSTSIQLSWKTEGLVSAVKLARATSADGDYEVLTSKLATTSYIDSDLEPGTTYYYRIWAANGAGDSEEFATVSAVTNELSKPESPQNMVAYSGNGYVHLSWSSTGEKTGYYQVKRSLTPSGPYTLIGRAMQNSYTDMRVANGGTYYYVVSAMNAVGEGDLSREVTATPQYGDCLYWPLDEGTGSEVVDVWNSQVSKLMNNSSFVSGKFFSGIRLNGGYMNLPNNVTKNWKDFTVSMWINPERVDNWARIIDCGSGTENNFFITVKAAQTGALRYSIKYNGGTEQQINTNFTPKTSSWTHIVLTQKDNLGILYANGVEIGRNENLTVSPSMLNSTNQNYIGRSAYSSDPYYYGIVDEFRVYDCALDTDLVKTLYQMSSQQITFKEMDEKKVGDDDFVPEASASSGLPVSFSSEDESIAEVLPTGKIRLLSEGLTKITAEQTGNLSYAAAVPVSQILSVQKGDAVKEVMSDGAQIEINVSNGVIHLSLPESDEKEREVCLYNLNGTRLRRVSAGNLDSLDIDVKDLSSGVYLMEISAKKSSMVIKVVL